jgi:endo-1,4-beta-D-glucanase Y
VPAARVSRATAAFRRDEGGDALSEGQAYALLIAVALGDRQRSDAVWTWTREHLRRTDGLLSWHWADAAVADANSAAVAVIGVPASRP